MKRILIFGVKGPRHTINVQMAVNEGDFGTALKACSDEQVYLVVEGSELSGKTFIVDDGISSRYT